MASEWYVCGDLHGGQATERPEGVVLRRRRMKYNVTQKNKKKKKKEKKQNRKEKNRGRQTWQKEDEPDREHEPEPRTSVRGSVRRSLCRHLRSPIHLAKLSQYITKSHTHHLFPRLTVYPSGLVCISILHAPGDDPNHYEHASERWSPIQSVEKILISVMSMLAEPNDESPANVEAAKMWRERRAEYEKKVRDGVRRMLGL